MEHVSPTSSSSTLADGGNPFLEDVVKPFLNYGGSKKGEKKATLDRRKRGDNPFQPTERGRAGSDFGSSAQSAQSAHVLETEGRGKSEEAETGFSLEGRQPELSSATLHPSEAAGDMEPLSIDSGVELQFNALMQLLEQPDNQTSEIETAGKEETKANKKLPPRPPDRTTSLAKAESPKIDENYETKNQSEKREPDIHENQPLCLSVETFQRFSVNYEVEATSDESLEDLEIVEALKPEPAVQETSDFDVSEDGFSESDKKDEEEVTFDFITAAADLSEEPSEGKRSNVGSVCVSDERDSGEREPARNIERVSRDPIQPAESDREPSNDELPRDSAADCQSSLASAAEQTADRESNSEGRSRSHIRPEEASQFVEEDMRINMIQPVYSQAHQVRRNIHFCHSSQPHKISNLDVT